MHVVLVSVFESDTKTTPICLPGAQLEVRNTSVFFPFLNHQNLQPATCIHTQGRLLYCQCALHAGE